MLGDTSENTEKSGSEAPNGSSVNEDSERVAASLRVRRLSSLGAAPSQRRRSHPVDQDIQCALQGIAMIRQRSNPIMQFCTGNRGQFLNTDNPRGPDVFYSGSKTWKRRITARLTQGGNDARGVDSDQVGLKIHDKLSALEAIKIELRHLVLASDGAEARKGQAVFGNLLGIGVDCRPVRFSPQAITLDLGRLDDRRLCQARHVEAKRPCRFRDIGIKGQIDFHAAHSGLPENTHD